MIAVDTNILIYAHREDSIWHGKADALITKLAEGGDRWAIPWACIHEFFGIVTNARVFRPPTPPSKALKEIANWLESPGLLVLAERAGYFEVLSDLVETAKLTGPRIHDARIFAICKQHGVKTLWTADRDFVRFSGLNVVNPLSDIFPST